MSIDRDHPLASAARDIDALSEEHGFDFIFKTLGLEKDDVIYVAQQRALRLALLHAGRGDLLGGTKPQTIPPGLVDKHMLQALTIMCLDGMAIGWKAALDA